MAGKGTDKKKARTVELAVPTLTISADQPGAIRGLVEFSRVVDTAEVHAALREFEMYETAKREAAMAEAAE